MPPRLSARLVALTLAITVGGCAIEQAKKPRPAVVSRAAPVEEGLKDFEPYARKDLADVAWLLNYFHHINGQAAAALDAEYQTAQQALSSDKTFRNRLRLALLLSIPTARFHDRARALNLLEEVTNRPAEENPALWDFAYLLINALSGEKQVKGDYQALEIRLKELQAANQKLQEQLDALKAIEKSIDERGKVEGNSAK